MTEFFFNSGRRERTLKEIRSKALIINIPLTDGRKIFLSVRKGKDAFNSFVGTNGLVAASLSDAAEHIYQQAGKNWRKSVVMKKDARRFERQEYSKRAEDVKRRDAPWPFTIPNLEKLESLHCHGQPDVFKRKV